MFVSKERYVVTNGIKARSFKQWTPCYRAFSQSWAESKT